MITANWGDFLKGVSGLVNEVIDDTQALAPSWEGTGLFKKEQADDIIYRTEGVTGLSYTELFDENDSIKEDKTYPAYKTEYVMRQHGKTITISQMLMNVRPALLAEKIDEVRQLRIAANRTLAKWGWQVLVDGFVTTNSSANFPTARLSDAVALYSTAHPSKVAGVANRSNRLASDPLLSETNLFTATRMIREQLNGRDLPIGYEGQFVLVVPPALEKLALEITGSTMRSGSADNDLNYFSGGKVDVISTVYLGAAGGGSDTAWYVFAKNAPQPSLRYVSLVEPKIEQTVDFNTKAIRVSVDYACAFGYSNFEFTAASDGTND